MVDEFIFHDDLQYTKGDWRNRNRIKTSSGLAWLTIPCGSSEQRLICEVEIRDNDWQRKHWAKISQSYHKSPFFKKYSPFFEDIYLNKRWHSLSELNQYIIKNISLKIFNIKTVFSDSRSYNLQLRKQDRVLELLTKVGADYYLSGPAAKNYLNIDLFLENNIQLEWMDYSNYPVYNQLFPPFEHFVSIIDLIFNEGSNSKKFLKSFKTTK